MLNNIPNSESIMLNDKRKPTSAKNILSLNYFHVYKYIESINNLNKAKPN